MKTQSPGKCRRNIEYIFDVDDTERLCIVYEEDYKGGFRCYIHVGDFRNSRTDSNVPFGCQPDFIGAEEVAAMWLKFHRLTPEGIIDL